MGPYRHRTDVEGSAPIPNEPTETSALLGQDDTCVRVDLFKQSGDYVAADESETTCQYELVLLIRNASPLIITCLLQYTLTGASVLAVGHLGRNELGAVSLA